MPTFFRGDEQIATDDPVQAAALHADGWRVAAMGQNELVVERGSGAQVAIDPELGKYVLGSTAPVSGTQQVEVGMDRTRDERYGGHGLGTALAGAGSVLTLGATDVMLDEMGVPIREYSEHNATARTVGELAAVAATALSPFGKGGLAKALTATPAGAISKFGTGGATALGRIAHVAGEGAAYGVGQAVSEIALAEPGVTAEQVVSELGQGALLGAALGGAAGAFGEGVRIASKAHAARKGVPVLDLKSGVGKESISGMARATTEFEDTIKFARDESDGFVKAAGESMGADRTAVLKARAAEVQATIDSMRPVAVDGVTKVTPKHADAFAAADKAFAKAVKTGKPQHQMDYLAQVESMARKAGAPELAEQAAKHIADNMAAAKGADEALAGMRVAFPEPPYAKVFDLKPNEKLGPAAFERLLRNEPKALIKRLAQLGTYFDDATKAAKGNPVAVARLADSKTVFKQALEGLVPGPTMAKLETMLPTILGLEAGVEVLVPEGPAKDLLRLAAAYKLIGGVVGLKGRMASRGLAKQLVRSIQRRAGAGLASGAVRGIPAVRAAGPALGTAAVAAGAGAGYAGVGALQRMTDGVRGVASSAAALDAHLTKAINRVAGGKPQRVRAMPGLNLILDKLVGSVESDAKTSKAKFAVVQDRLAKYAVAPDAAMNGVYEMLRPVQEVNEQLADLMESVLGVQLDYLLDKMPRDPGTMVMFGKSMWQPTDRELYEFGLHAMGVLMPLEVADMIADGIVPPQAAQALAATNPEIFTKLQMGIIQRADEVRENSTYNQRIALGIAFQLPLDPTADPRYVAFMQDMHAQKTMEQAAGDAGESKTPDESFSDAQKLLA